MPRVLCLTAAALLVAIWGHALVGFGGSGVDDFFGRWMHDAVILSAAFACLAGAIRVGRDRLAWAALAAGLLATAAGDIIYSLAPALAAVPVPSVSDPLWLAIYPCEYVALLALIRSRVGPTLWAVRLDGLAGGLAVASVLACFTVSAAVAGSAGAPFWEAATNLAYPVGDLILLGAIVSAVGLAGWRVDRLWATLGAAIVALEAADMIYMFGADGRLGPIADALAATGIAGLAWAATFAPPAREPLAARTADRGLFIPVAVGALALGMLAIGVPLHVEPVALGLAVAALALVLVRMALALSENHALLSTSRVEAATDALTGLSNRRKLQLDLDRVLAGHGSHALVLLDLNGFKAYNDSYGHGAGDMLLRQLSLALAHALDGRGTAYRMGGDEFCVLAPACDDLDGFSARCAAALAAQGDGFTISAAYGAVLLPQEGRDPSTALALADARMYRHKNAGRPPAAHQSADVLMAVVSERAPGLASHVHAVCELACAAAEQLGVTDSELEAVRHAAALHDIGKMAIPDSILDTPGPLSDAEWALIREHTVIGERILAAAPALERSARLVRSSHEHFDGSGYPDGLAGEEIPLGSRIILVADAFDAMVSERSYGTKRSETAALAELRRCAGTQFDPAAVAAFERVLARRGDARATSPRSALPAQ
jgi:diguanylate cyclase (GGDEF)-like protein/putative nucleotidyltransferase with HDIG domain